MTMVRRAPSQNRAKKTVDRILDAARSILSEEGAGAFNTNRIAQTARVSVGSLYEYFPDKDAIIDRISEDMAKKETGEVLDLLRKKSGGSPTEVVESVVGLLFDLYRNHLSLYRGVRTIRAVRECRYPAGGAGHHGRGSCHSRSPCQETGDRGSGAHELYALSSG